MKQIIRTWGLLIAFIIGALFPAIGGLADWMGLSISVMLGIAFLGADAGKIRLRRQHVYLLLATLGLAFGSWGLLSLAGLPILALAAFYVAAAPVGTAVPVLTNLLNGDVEFAVTGQIFSNFCMALLLPIIVPLTLMANAANAAATPSFIELLWGVLSRASTLILIPGAVVILLRLVHPGSREWAPKLKDLSLYLWIFTLTVIAGRAVMQLDASDVPWWELSSVFFVSLALCALSFYLGLFIGKPRYTLECQVALGQKSTIITLYLAMTFGGNQPLVFFAPIFYSVVQNLLNSYMVSKQARKHAGEESAHHGVHCAAAPDARFLQRAGPARQSPEPD